MGTERRRCLLAAEKETKKGLFRLRTYQRLSSSYPIYKKVQPCEGKARTPGDSEKEDVVVPRAEWRGLTFEEGSKGVVK